MLFLTKKHLKMYSDISKIEKGEYRVGLKEKGNSGSYEK